MEIRNKIQTKMSGEVEVVYKDISNYEELEKIVVNHVHVYAFCSGKLVLVRDRERNAWMPPGGKVEDKESCKDAEAREIKEETNMRLTYQEPIGLQTIYEPQRIINQTRSFAIAEPYGPFVSDPDNDIVEIKLIDPKDASKYFDWKEVGAHVLKRAIEMYEKYEHEN